MRTDRMQRGNNINHGSYTYYSIAFHLKTLALWLACAPNVMSVHRHREAHALKCAQMKRSPAWTCVPSLQPRGGIVRGSIYHGCVCGEGAGSSGVVGGACLSQGHRVLLSSCESFGSKYKKWFYGFPGLVEESWVYFSSRGSSWLVVLLNKINTLKSRDSWV